MSTELYSQTHGNNLITALRVETRADITADNIGNENRYGFGGKYFDVRMGGEIGEKFSYYIRQNIVAQPGTTSFFDNTDFLYLSYKQNDNLSFRIGKDAMAIGGFEYDAAPMDVYNPSEYWNNIYCFQLGGSAIISLPSKDHQFVFNITNSPYINSRNLPYNYGLLSYNIEYKGSWGHLSTLSSVSMIEHEKGKFMNLTAIGMMLKYEKWDAYIDMVNRALAINDWCKNYSAVGRANFNIATSFNLFIKASYDQNRSDYEDFSFSSIDNMVEAGHSHTKLGVGCEYYATSTRKVRFHTFVAYLKDEDLTFSTITNEGILADIGISWWLDIIKK